MSKTGIFSHPSTPDSEAPISRKDMSHNHIVAVMHRRTSWPFQICADRHLLILGHENRQVRFVFLNSTSLYTEIRIMNLFTFTQRKALEYPPRIIQGSLPSHEIYFQQDFGCTSPSIQKILSTPHEPIPWILG